MYPSASGRGAAGASRNTTWMLGSQPPAAREEVDELHQTSSTATQCFGRIFTPFRVNIAQSFSSQVEKIRGGEIRGGENYVRGAEG